MGWKATFYAIVACCLLMYMPLRWISVVSIASTTEGYSHSLPDPRFAVIPLICHAAQWWNPSRTLTISPFTTHIFLPYNITDSGTALYIIPRVRTVAPVISITLATIPHCL